MPALLFGSISTLADTSDLQRAAFNEAFSAAGLDWYWEREEYQTLLTGNGGRDRIAEYARNRGETVDADALHAAKSENFQRSLGAAPVGARPGVAATIRAAKDAGWQVGLVTTTSGENIDALLDGLANEIDRADLDVIVDIATVERPKPDPAAYTFALHALAQEQGSCVAIEDNLGGVQSAVAAGITCVAFPNENTAGHDFGDTPRTAHLHFDELAALISQTASGSAS